MSSNGAEPSLEARVREVEIAQAGYAQEVGYIHKSLDDLKTLMKTSVQLQERQVSHRDSLGRAFKAIGDSEREIETIKGEVDTVKQGLSKHIHRAEGAIWVIGIGWTVTIGIAGFLVWIIL